MSSVFIAHARRTAVVPVNGGFRSLAVQNLVTPLVRDALACTGTSAAQVDQVILGNALYGGGNPARLCALAAGLPESVPATTVDTQCCSGLDAIRLGAQVIRAGQADVVIAGGVESYSRRPYRAIAGDNREPYQFYERPPFTPWPDRDPDMAESAARLAAAAAVTRDRQHQWVIESHRKALGAASLPEILPLAGIRMDPAARVMTKRLCERSRVIAEAGPGVVDVASTALQADGAALCLLVSERAFSHMMLRQRPVRWLDGRPGAGAADDPPGALVAAARALLDRYGISAGELAVAELMEAFAVQALQNTRALGLPESVVNRGGGALARGHPIGASGAVLVARAVAELQKEAAGRRGLIAIGAAGGVSSAALLEIV